MASVMARVSLAASTPTSSLPPDTDLGPAFLATTWTLFGLAFIAVAVRVATRAYNKASNGPSWDDYTIALALLFTLATSVLNTHEYKAGFGQHSAYLSDEQQEKIIHRFYIYILVNFWTLFFLRASVCIYVIRNLQSVPKSALLTFFTALVLNFATTVIGEVSYGVRCIPFSAISDPNVDGTCESQSVVRSTVIVSGVFDCVADFLTASMPLFLMQDLRNVSLSLDIGVTTLFGLGYLIAGLSIAKAVFAVKVSSSGDPVWAVVPLEFVAIFEDKLGILVACLPTLRQTYLSIRQLRHNNTNAATVPASKVHSMQEVYNPDANGRTRQMLVMFSSESTRSTTPARGMTPRFSQVSPIYSPLTRNVRGASNGNARNETRSTHLDAIEDVDLEIARTAQPSSVPAESIQPTPVPEQERSLSNRPSMFIRDHIVNLMKPQTHVEEHPIIRESRERENRPSVGDTEAEASNSGGLRRTRAEKDLNVGINNDSIQEAAKEEEEEQRPSPLSKLHTRKKKSKRRLTAGRDSAWYESDSGASSIGTPTANTAEALRAKEDKRLEQYRRPLSDWRKHYGMRPSKR